MDKDLPFIVVLILGVLGFIFLQNYLSQQSAITQAQLQISNQNASNPWLTVPGAVNQGLAGVGSIANSLNNLFSSIGG